jgi:hypothetical protein
MGVGAMVAGVLVVLAAMAGAVVSRWWHRGTAGPDTAGTAGWELLDAREEGIDVHHVKMQHM